MQRVSEHVVVTPDVAFWKSWRVPVSGHAGFKSERPAIWLKWLDTNVTRHCICAITQMIASADARRMAAQAGHACAEAAVDQEAVLAKWDRVFASMGFDFTREAERLP